MSKTPAKKETAKKEAAAPAQKQTARNQHSKKEAAAKDADEFESKFDSDSIVEKSGVRKAMAGILKEADEILRKLDGSPEKEYAQHNYSNILYHKDMSANEYNTLEQDLYFIQQAELQVYYMKQLI